MICPICNTDTYTVFIKFGIHYDICFNCRCCYTLDEVKPETHNQGSEVRNNNNVNKLRFERIEFYGPENIETMIDFGCGNGQFVELMSTFYEEVVGIDQNTKIQLEHIQDNSTDVINCVEVIEHLISPKEIVDHFYRVLKPGGIIYLESSFTDFLGYLSMSCYVNPNIGHVLVHSHKSLEMLFNKFEIKWLNQNVCILKKV